MPVFLQCSQKFWKSDGLQILLLNTKTEIRSRKSIDNDFDHYFKDNNEHSNRLFRLSLLILNCNKSSLFSMKSLNYAVINSYLLKLSTLTIAIFTFSTKTDITLQTSLKSLRASTIWSKFTPDCRYDNIIIKLFGNVHCPNEMRFGKLCLNKKIFQPLSRCDHQCSQYTSSPQVRNIPFEEQTNWILLKCDQCFILFEKKQKSIQGVIGDVDCPGSFC